jgi:hypothetical protein
VYHQSRLEKLERKLKPRKRLAVFVVHSTEEMQKIAAEHPGKPLRFILDNIPRKAQAGA